MHELGDHRVMAEDILADEDGELSEDLGESSPKRFKESKEKSKYSGAFKYQTKFSKEWTKTWPFISTVPGDSYSARCNVCAKTVSTAHQGAADICSHVRSQAHSKLAKVAAAQPKLSFVSSNPLADKVCH